MHLKKLNSNILFVKLMVMTDFKFLLKLSSNVFLIQLVFLTNLSAFSAVQQPELAAQDSNEKVKFMSGQMSADILQGLPVTKSAFFLRSTEAIEGESIGSPKGNEFEKGNKKETFNKKRPNVIVILTDDQGTQDINIFGAEDLFTPHMDALAKSGVRFTQFYAASSVCSPSRAALLTGKYPQKVNVPSVVGYIEGNEGMPSEQVTMAEIFRNEGYRTGLIGKWHLGYLPETLPNGQGFDYFFGHQGGCIDNYSHFFYWNGPNRHDLWRNEKKVSYEGKFYPDLMAEEVGSFMESNQQEPFFLYWAINLPHYPLQPPKKWLEKYEQLPHPRKKYAAFVSTMDEMIGKVMVKLDELGLKDNTIIVFQSDHGHSIEERTFGGGGDAGPYRGAKKSFFEGGIRVPAMISWSGKIPVGEVRDQMATATDWLPTLAELCEIKIDKQNLDGKSILPIIQSKETKSHHQVFHWGLRDQWAVRSGPWKLYGNFLNSNEKELLTEANSLFLVNLEEDPAEETNVAQQHPKKVKELRKEHENWEKEMAEY